MTLKTHCMSKDMRDRITNLRIDDRKTHGHPVFAAGESAIVREWLAEILVDADKLREHLALLASLYGGSFVPLPLRSERGEEVFRPSSGPFLHCAPLSDSVAEKIAEGGPRALHDADILSDPEAARLMLNPFALHDLADLIRSRLADPWMDALAEAGRSILQRHDIDLDVPQPRKKARRFKEVLRNRDSKGPGPSPKQRGGSVPVPFVEADGAKKRELAALLYGDEACDFALTLHWRKQESAGWVVELQVAPAPLKDATTLTLRIGGKDYHFTLMAPPRDPEADPPTIAFARASELVPHEAFPLHGEATWSDARHAVLREMPPEGDHVAATDPHPAKVR